MNAIEQIRSKLQKRAQRLRATHWKMFHLGLVQFRMHIENEPILNSLLAELCQKASPSDTEVVENVKAGKWNPVAEIDEARTAFQIVNYCCSLSDSTIERNLACKFHEFAAYKEYEEAQAKFFFDTFVLPLSNYLEEHLDETRFILHLLRRYKHLCEWFNRSELSNVYADEKARGKQPGQKSRGEKQLALHLYEYLYSNGVTFSIEPTSISGAADLVAAQQGNDPLIADVKIFDPDSNKNKSYLVSGFNQVYQYTHDYNESIGYLVIFKTCEAGLAISSGQQEQNISFLTFNGKTLFFVIIDLFEHSNPASQRGKLKSYIITEQEIISPTN